MSKIGVSLKIDVSKIEKARLFKGAKGNYLDATVFIDLDQLDQYDNSGMITQDVKKEEKDSGVKGPILANCKLFWTEGGQAPQQQPQRQQPAQQGFTGQAPAMQQQAAPAFDDFEDDLPF